MTVSEIEPEKVRIAFLILRNSGDGLTAWASGRFWRMHQSSSGAFAIKPMRDGAARQADRFTDLAEGDACGHHCRRALAQVRWMHSDIIEQGCDNF